MNGGKRLQRRDQLVLGGLIEALEGEKVSDETLRTVRARARNLPTMLRRHGPIQVLLFLQAKGGGEGSVDDRSLAGWLIQGLRKVLFIRPKIDAAEYAKDLAGLPLAEYLIHWRTSVDAASWLKRLIEARTERFVPPGGQAHGA